MFKSWWEKIKQWLLSRLEDAILKEIDELDRYEDDLASLIKEHLNPKEKSKALVDYAQEKLTAVVTKAFDSKWLSRSFFSHFEEKLLDEIERLDRYEKKLANIIRKHLNAKEKSKLVVDFVQEYLKALVKKYIKKI